MNLKVFATNSLLSAAVFASLASFTTHVDANEADLKLKFEASIDRINGIAPELMPDSVSIGTTITGIITIENSIQIETPTMLPGDGFYWGRELDGKPVAHVLFDAPLLSNFEHTYFGVQKPPGGKVAINCAPLFCDFSGELKTTDGKIWNADYLSLQAPIDISSIEMSLRDATDLLREASANGETKIILRYKGNSIGNDAIRIILTVSVLDYQ